MPASAMNCGRMPPDRAGTTEDAVLGGRLILEQPERGHRIGHDAILLAAATAARPGEHAVELGAGVGAAGIALASRIDGLSVTLIEIDPALAALAMENARRNHLASRTNVVVLDVLADREDFRNHGLKPASADRVLMNPPFNDAARHNVSPDLQRRAAHSAGSETLGGWVKAAERLLRPSGVLTMIWRADGLDEVMQALRPSFGGCAILPVYAKPGSSAIRVLAGAIKGSRAPLSLLPGLVLNDADGRPTPEAEAVLRAGGELPLFRA